MYGDFPGGSDGKESACNAGDLGLIPSSGRSPGEGNDYHSSILAWNILWTEYMHMLCKWFLSANHISWVSFPITIYRASISF